MKDYFIHESSYADEGCIIGRDTKIWHFFSYYEECCHRRTVFDRTECQCRPAGRLIGNGVKIQNNVSVYDDVIIEDDVFCGPSCVFTNVTNPRAFVERKHEYKKTVIKKGASIGANATIVCGVTMGRLFICRRRKRCNP